MHRPVVRAMIVAIAVGGALTGLTACTGGDSPAASTGPVDCAGKVKMVLLGDESATTPVPFDAGSAQKIFAIAASPAANCAYQSSSDLSQSGQSYTVTDNTYLYVGISSADAQKLIAGITAATGAAPWTADYSNAPAPSASPAPSTSISAKWEYNLAGGPADLKGSMAYVYSAPLSPGLVVQAALTGTPNVLRIETELRTLKK